MSRKSKVGVEDKVTAVKECLSGKCSAENAAQQLGVSKTSVLNWISLYSSEGIDGLLPRTTNRIYSPELKERAVKDYLSGEGSLRQICKKYKIRDRKELKGWIKVYNGHKDFREHTGGCRMTKARKTTIEERMSRVARCIDNGPMEGFWGILKRERYYGRRFTSREELVSMIENYITYYNNRRVQRNLGVLTPMEKHKNYLMAA